MNVIGIDPGQNGAIVTYDKDFLRIFPMKDKGEIEIACEIKSMSEKHTTCYLEKVHSMPSQGVASTFKFGKGYGFLRGCLTLSGVEIIDVTPQKWQKELDCRTKGDKNVTKNKAKELFKDVKVTHGIADGLLIAYYGWLKEEGKI